MADADKKSSEVKQLKKKISEELNEIDKDIKYMEKAKKDSVEKIEIKKVELKKFSNTQAVCDEHYATLQEIEQASKLIEERKISITALDETITNLDMQISKIQSEHDKAVAELEKKRRRLNEYLKYYEDLNDKLEKLIQLLGEEEKKHCIELNNLKVERDKTLARTDLSENALNKLLQQLDNKMVDLNTEHGKLIDSISQKLSEITVDASGVEELLSENKPAAKKKKKADGDAAAGEDTEDVDEEKKTDEERESGKKEEVKTKEEPEKPGTAKSDESKKEAKIEKKHKSGSEVKGEAGKKDHEGEVKDEQKQIKGDEQKQIKGDEQKPIKADEKSSEGDYESSDQEGSVAKGHKKIKKKPSKLETEVDQQLKKLKKKKRAQKAGGEGESEEDDDDDEVSFDFDDEELLDWFSLNEKDVRLDLLRQGMQITPSNRIITPDDRILTLKQAQRLGLLEEGAEEDEETESSDFEGTRSKKKKAYNKQLKYYQSPTSSASTLGKESSESRICGRDVEYLKVVFGKSLTIALAEITAIQPVDPIHYLAHWMLKYRYNQEIDQITRIQIQELMIEQERLAAEKWHRELQEEARLAVLEALFRAENIIIQQDFQSQLLQEYEGEYEDSPQMAV